MNPFWFRINLVIMTWIQIKFGWFVDVIYAGEEFNPCSALFYQETWFLSLEVFWN